MIYTDFKGEKLSRLGFGAMRLPTLSDGSVDEAQVFEMVDMAMERGVNYFDTAFSYHGGDSEIVLGRALARYPRESFHLADKFPGHQLMEAGYHPAPIFEKQLKRCGVEYFDYYLLHNVYEKSMDVYLDPQWGILEYFLEQKRLGRIRHLGFSSHARPDALKAFLDRCGGHLEFCLIQLNYLDWTLQDAKRKYDLLTERGLGVWVMEPLRGGRLANLSDAEAAPLRSIDPQRTNPQWAFGFLQRLDNVRVILSGMSALEQMRQNTETFTKGSPLTDAEAEAVLTVAEGMKDSVPCTACRYCCEGCPMGLDIPMLLETYNELRVAPLVNSVMRIEFAPEDKKPTACIGCGKCARVCPQNIDIPGVLKSLSGTLAKMPRWTDISRAREEEAQYK